jgi:RNA polymerase sigma-32 factor
MSDKDTIERHRTPPDITLESTGVPKTESTEITRYDPLRRYMAEIARFAPLSRDEEHSLAVDYRKTGDRETAYRLVTSNLKLVVKIAMIYQKVYRNLLDLIQEGNLGLRPIF